MAGLLSKKQKAREVLSHLRPGGNLLSLSCEDNWVLGHIEADVATASDAVLITHTLHVPYRWRGRWSARMRRYVAGVDTRLEWFAPHCATDSAPGIPQVVIFGNGAPQCRAVHNAIDSALFRFYTRSFDNGYARLWDRK
jgi:hypothetical protein